jgi:hypothetical protein
VLLMPPHFADAKEFRGARMLQAIRIVEERAPYLLIAHKAQFAVLERRNGKLYSLHGRHRAPASMSDAGAHAAVGTGWRDEKTARRIFSDVVTRYTDLAEHLW